jgi:transcriptional regulator with XRE-family HTH domain
MPIRPTDTLHDVGEFIRQQRENAQKSIRDLARSAGVSNPYLSQIERGIRRPSADILQQIARALEISAINNDERLTAEQKQSLLSVYRSFVGPVAAE